MEEPRWVWGVTEGECGVRPGPAVRVGQLGEDEASSILDSGRHCFWALGIDGACRIRAGASTSRRLPDEAGAVTLRVDETACVSEDDAPSWDAVVEAIAGCVPSCEPTRCRCSGAPSCAEAGEAGMCPAPVTANLLDLGATHGCAALRGDSVMWCWDVDGGSPERWDTPTAVDSLAVGPNTTCYIGAPSDDAADADRPTVWCRRAVDEVWGEWLAVDRDGTCVDAPLLVLPDLFLDGLDVGDGFVCAFVANATRRGVACWGLGRGGVGNPLATAADGVIDCSSDSSSWLAGPWLADLPLTSPTMVSTGDDHVCAIVDGVPRCWGAIDVPGCLGDGGTPRADHIEVLSSGGVACARTLQGQLCCSDDGFAEGLTDASIFDAGGGEVFACGRRVGRPDLCGRREGGGVPLRPVTDSVAGPGIACGIAAGDGGGAVFCQRIDGGSGTAGGASYASPGEPWVCPGGPR